jgi:hypothetical protein
MIRALIIGILSAGALVACSTTPSQPAVHTASAAQSSTCPKTQTAGPSSCYSQKQLRQTGKVADVAHSLQMLDPDVTVHGN